ncbi:MAG: NAD(P)H-dependent oxidoreductase subunit E, partial [Gemmatimonadota bacterium]
MSLIHELERLQEERGYLSEDSLRELSHAVGSPLFRLQELVSFYPHFRTTPPAGTTVNVCRDMSCHLAGAEGLAGRVAAACEELDVEVEETSCLGCCELAPAVRVNGAPLQLEDPEGLVSSLSNGGPPARSHPGYREWACDPYGGEPETGYECFRQTLAQIDQGGAIESLIQTLKDSGLRGMGGAGFPTGLKWELVRKETATPKYVICNADESEPGTFKDRVMMEELPWLVVEGMMLAGLVIGSGRGILYLRHEYHAAREALERELARARDQGWLGDDILGSGFSFDVELFISPGGYILGEETALLEALEDKRGEPRNKPPFPGQKGLWDKPTLMNNVETFAYVPIIGLKGADWWQDQGKRGS